MTTILFEGTPEALLAAIIALGVLVTLNVVPTHQRGKYIVIYS